MNYVCIKNAVKTIGIKIEGLNCLFFCKHRSAYVSPIAFQYKESVGDNSTIMPHGYTLP